MKKMPDPGNELSVLDATIKRANVGLGVLMVGVLAAYFFWFALKVKDPISQSSSNWGTLGDYFGGLINPLIGALTLYWLTKSVRAQKEELYATREALEESAQGQLHQVRLSALTALTTVIMTEVDIQRSQLMFICNQMSSLQHSSIRNLEGSELTPDAAKDLIASINKRISSRMLEQLMYEDEIKELLRQTIKK